MRNLIRASLLVLALSCSTYAGNMPINYNPPPPSPSPANSTPQTDDTASLDGWIGTGLTETVLNTFGNVLSLL